MSKRKTSRSRAPVSKEQRADSRLASYMAGAKRVGESVIPGTEHLFVWRRLSVRQKQEAVDAAVKRFEKTSLPLELRSYSDFDDEVALQVLFRAMRDPDDSGTDSDPYPQLLAASAGELGEYFDDDTRDLLAIEYRDFEDDLSPLGEEPSEDELTELERAIQKKDSRQLSSFAPRTLRHWLLTTGSQLLNSTTTKS